LPWHRVASRRGHTRRTQRSMPGRSGPLLTKSAKSNTPARLPRASRSRTRDYAEQDRDLPNISRCDCTLGFGASRLGHELVVQWPALLLLAIASARGGGRGQPPSLHIQPVSHSQTVDGIRDCGGSCARSRCSRIEGQQAPGSANTFKPGPTEQAKQHALETVRAHTTAEGNWGLFGLMYKSRRC
jgi:hypothetical protein